MIKRNVLSEQNSKCVDVHETLLYWNIGRGLQAVDYLQTSKKLNELINLHLNGEKTYLEIEKEMKDFHMKNGSFLTRLYEADVAAVRIAMLLSKNSFDFSKKELQETHRIIFNGLLNNKDEEGRFRRINIEKEEDVLDGKSAVYTDYKNIEEYLDYDLQEERNRIRNEKIDDIVHLSKFVSNIWNIHPFREGNTRTTAVFVVRYLRANGINVTNDLFKENSLYFRNALVLSSDNQSNIPTTYEYVESFFYKLLKDKDAKLKQIKNSID